MNRNKKRKKGDICYVGSGSTKVEILKIEMTEKGKILCKVIETGSKSKYVINKEYYIPARTLSCIQVNFPNGNDNKIKELILEILENESGLSYHSIEKSIEGNLKTNPFRLHFIMSELIKDRKVRWEGRIKDRIISNKNPKIFFINEN